jgi:hypothetical protein
VILAPFTSHYQASGTIANTSLESDQSGAHPLLKCNDFKEFFVKKARRVIKFGAIASTANREYEHNNNAELDNGIINDCLVSQDASSSIHIEQ